MKTLWIPIGPSWVRWFMTPVLAVFVGACASTAAPSAAPSTSAAASAAPSAAPSAAGSEGAVVCNGSLPPEYTIGLNLGLTGWMAPYDTEARDGFLLAVEEINAKGGIGGVSKIVTTVKDDRTDAAEAAKIATEQAQAGVDLMVLPGDASLSIPSGQIAQAAGIPMMSLLASTVTQRDTVGDFFFSNGQADTLAGAASAKYAIDNGMKTAFLITSPNSPWWYLPQAYFKETFEKLGGTVVGSDEFRGGDQDFSAIIGKITGLTPDVLYTTMGEPEFPAFMRQLRAAGSEAVMFGSESIDTEATLSLGQTIDGALAVTSGFASPGDSLDQFDTHFQESTGHPAVGALQAVGYDAAYLIAYAVEKACSGDGGAVRDALDTAQGFTGVLGDYEFGPIPGYSNCPVAVVKWTTDASGKVTAAKVSDLTVPAGDIPEGQQ